jgi:TolC family type I secretion outer membrane protein
MLVKKFLILSALCTLPLLAKSDTETAKKHTDLQKKDKSEKNTKDNRCILFRAFENALKTNKDILSMEYEIRAANESYIQGRSRFLPNISADTSFSASDTDTWNSDAPSVAVTNKSDSRQRTKSYGITANYNLFHGTADIASLKEVSSQLKARWSKYEAMKQKILREVAAYYFEIFAKMQELLHLKALLKSRQGSYEVAQEMYKTGAAKYLDVAQASAGCAEVEAKLAKANADYEAYRAKFTELTGFVLPITIDAPKQLFDTKMTLKQGTDLAMRYNPNIIAAADELAATREASKKPFGKLLPSIDFQYSFNQSVNNTNMTDLRGNTRGHTVRLVASIPIYDGGVGRSEKRQAQDMVSKAVVDSEKTIDSVRTEVISVWSALTAAKLNIESAEKAVQAREVALRDTDEEYRAGSKIMNDVLKAQQELFEAKYLEIQAKKEYFVNQCAANALIGRMNPRFLKLETQGSEFNCEDHFSRVKGKL